MSNCACGRCKQYARPETSDPGIELRKEVARLRAENAAMLRHNVQPFFDGKRQGFMPSGGVTGPRPFRTRQEAEAAYLAFAKEFFGDGATIAKNERPTIVETLAELRVGSPAPRKARARSGNLPVYPDRLEKVVPRHAMEVSVPPGNHDDRQAELTSRTQRADLEDPRVFEPGTLRSVPGCYFGIIR